jgi:undecaprenyl-diphosphatase
VDPLSAAILGLVQALTEFLPVSSSGHLVLAHRVLDVSSQKGLAADAFAVAVHFGTLLSVFIVFWPDISALFRSVGRAARKPFSVKSQWRDDPDLRLTTAILVGCIPAGFVGLLFKDQLEAAFHAPTLVCWALVGTGCVLLTTRFARSGHGSVGLGSACLIGLAQAVAIIPGVSRSGSTIAMAMFLGIEREQAAKYSFLLSLPVIAGASGLKAMELGAQSLPEGTWFSLGLGALVAFVVGIGALKVLMVVVKRGAFSHFGWYCIAVGTVGLMYV